MKIAILGLRGIPSPYSGYEAFVGELAPRLAARGHEVTVYCRSALFPEKPPSWRGVRLRYLPNLEHKITGTLSHALLCVVDASLRRFDVVFVVNAANGMFGFIPRLLGRRSVLNVDGMEWLRPKWNRLAQFVFKNSARLGCLFYDRVVTDAEEMHRLYAREFGIDTEYIAYGADIEPPGDPARLAKYGLEPGGYYLVVSRMVPDNNLDLSVREFVRSGSRRLLAVAGGADYRGNEKELRFLARLKEMADSRVRFLGHINDRDDLTALHGHSYAYIHGHQHGGINPSLLRAMGLGNCVLALDTPFNAEALDNGRYGLLWKRDDGSLSRLIDRLDADEPLRDGMSRLAPERIRERFTWDRITSQYETLFAGLAPERRGASR